MRTLLLLPLAGAILATPAAAATRNFGISGFTKVRVDGPFRVTLTTNVAPFARANGSPAALDRVGVEMRGDTLVVRASQSWGGYNDTNAGPVEIELGTHDLSNATLVGSGLVAIDRVKGLGFGLSVQGSGAAQIGQLEVDQLNVNLGGTANARLAGSAKKLTATVRGLSMLDATGLSTKDATIATEGAATINASVSNSASVSANGPATIALSNSPACTLRVSWSTSVSGCRPPQ